MPIVPLGTKSPSTTSSVAPNQSAKRGPLNPAPSRTPAGRAAPAPPAWRSKTVANKSTAPSAFMRQALNTNASRIDPSVASATQKLNINSGPPPTPPNDCLDPSLGPVPPNDIHAAWQGSACPTLNSGISTYDIAVFNNIYRRTTRTINDFKQGEVISVPYHVPNLNPALKAGHPRLAITCEGHVHSKRRIVVILFKFQQDMLCLSMFTHEGKGLSGKPEHLKNEYVCVMNKDAQKFRNTGRYQPIEVESYDPSRPMKETSCIKLTGAVTVSVSEHVSYVGRVDKASYTRLVTLYEQRNKLAKQTQWEADMPRPSVAPKK